MAPISGSGPLSPSPPQVEAFERAAEAGEQVFMEIDGERVRVRGQGALPGSGRRVAWIDSDGAGNVAKVFADALAERFGSRVADSVARELGLENIGGKAIASRLVQQAIDMARTASTALGGSHFATTLQHGAVANSPSFLAAAEAIGVAAKDIDDVQRVAIDAAFVRLLGDAPVSEEAGRRLIEEAVRSVVQSSGEKG